MQFGPALDSDRLLLGKVILHAADISSACRPFPINCKLSKRVHKEFEQLAALERELDIPITFKIDPNNELMCAQVSSQAARIPEAQCTHPHKRHLALPFFPLNRPCLLPSSTHQMEVNFLDYVVKPLWERVSEVLPEVQPAYQTILLNREEYSRIMEQERGKAGATPTPVTAPAAATTAATTDTK